MDSRHDGRSYDLSIGREYDLELNNDDVDTPFPKNFKEVVKTIFKRLFRIYAHMYYSHIQGIKTACNSTSFRFLLETTEFRRFLKKLKGS